MVDLERGVIVPNAPCGVESFLKGSGLCSSLLVPNAPCGVERFVIYINSTS